MFAERLIVETDSQGNPTAKLPDLPPNSMVEMIFIVLGERKDIPVRHPSPSIAGKGKILGDIVSPIVPEDEWDVLQ
jgi:hypothetical protein